MNRNLLLAAALLAVPCAGLAQAVPQASGTNPRVQMVGWVEGQVIQLTMLPDTAMTVAFEPGEIIDDVMVGDRSALAARVAAERSTLQLLPQREGDLGQIIVVTNRRDYRFTAQAGSGVHAAYLVEVRPGAVNAGQVSSDTLQASADGETWSYRLRGDRSVLPSRIFDDGRRTSIIFDPAAALPAIFAIGSTGEEQLVNGYMRGNVFVIDRVWSELVFRIDKEKGTARRNAEPEKSDG